MQGNRLVLGFDEGEAGMRDLLGGKGANLAEMTRMGLPVPPGFTVTTEACRAFLRAGAEPAGLTDEVDLHIGRLEQAMGRALGDPKNPLLVSVRSGARYSMPGMMDTVLNIGLTDASVDGLVQVSGDPRFAWDAYRRLMQMFGKTVMGIDGGRFEAALSECKARQGVTSDVALTAPSLRALVEAYRGVIQQESGHDFPQDPREQLRMAIRAVFSSWNTERARIYRRQERIPEDLGTAVNVQAMVFGNAGAGAGSGPGSGTGVAFTRDPATGEPGAYGDYLPDAQGEDVVAGIRNTLPLSALPDLDPTSHKQLLGFMDQLERHYRDLCDIEFTIERGRLWMLQVRVGKRTAAAAFRIAVQLVEEGIITLDEALARVSGQQLAQLMFPTFTPAGERTTIATGVAASPGAAVGRIAFDTESAVRMAEAGDDVILVRRETNPDDLAGLVAARGVLTSHGGKTSHAAVVARGMGRTAVCGAEELVIDVSARRLTAPDGRVLVEGDVVSLDGASGEVYLGAVDVEDSAVVRLFDEGLVPALDGVDDATADLLRSVDLLMTHADVRRRLGVLANADTAEDAARARRMGAQGIGLLRIEHMLLGERRLIVERLILAHDDQDREAAFDELGEVLRQDLVGVLEAMDALPVVVRLIDPPLHEFLPNRTDLAIAVAIAKERGAPDEQAARLLDEVSRLHEDNPMLGLRGVRLGIVMPGLIEAQVRAIAHAACDRLDAGGHPRPQIMVPLVGAAEELVLVADEVDRVVAEVAAQRGHLLRVPVGTMIELPRAALMAGTIAHRASFFSFGTNDLTQMTWGFSRDDVEGAFFSDYLEQGVFAVSPFETIDVDGVGELIRLAVERGRATRQGLHCSVCGEHGGDPDSITFFHEVGLDHVSCSPFRVPVARLAAARAAVAGSAGQESR